MLGADRDLVQGLGEDEQATLRPHHAQDQDRRRRSKEGCDLRDLRRRAGARPDRSPTTWSCWRWVAARTASKIGADKAGVAVTDRGFIPTDSQLRTNVAHIHAIGDIRGQPMLAHKAVHEAHVAAEAAAGEKSFFDARVIPSVAYTDPEIAWAGITEDEAKAQGVAIQKGLFPWAASGRAIANGRDEGFTKLLFDAATHRIVGGGIVGTHAGDLICRDRAGDRDGRGRGRHRQDHPSAPDALRIGRICGRGIRRRVHRPARRHERNHDPRRTEAARRPRGDQVRRRRRVHRRRQWLDCQLLHRRTRQDQEPHQGRRRQLGENRRKAYATRHCRKSN